MGDAITIGTIAYQLANMDPIDFASAFQNSEILDEILKIFQLYSVLGAHKLKDVALNICCFLIAIDFATDWTLYDGNVRISKFINSIIKSCFFLFIIWNWKFFVAIIQHFFTHVGLLAGDSTDKVLSPSSILNQGFTICEKLFVALLKALGVEPAAKTESSNALMQLAGAAWDFAKTLAGAGLNYILGKVSALQVLCYLTAIVLVIFSHFWIALQVFLCQVEFSIFTALATIFLPFGVCRYTKFLFDRSIQGVVNFGVKLMGLYFLLAIAQNGVHLTTQSVIPDDKGFAYYLQIGLLYLVIAYLIWVLPDKLGALMSGSPSLSGRETVATALGAGAVAYGGAKYVSTIPDRIVETYNDMSTTWDRTRGNYVEVPEMENTGNYVQVKRNGKVYYEPEQRATGRTVWKYQVDDEEPGLITRAGRYVKFQAQQGLLGSLFAPYVRGGASAQRRNENWVHMRNGDWGNVRYDYK